MTEMNNYYFKEMEKIPLLSAEEEKALGAKAFKGDKAAQKKLVEANLRFVIKIANHYTGYMEKEDLISEGNLGLIHAAQKFDPSTGNRFSTYAVWWIKAYIQKAIRETSTGIRFPASQFKEMKSSKWNIASLDKAVEGDDGEETTLMSFLNDDRLISPEDQCWINESASQVMELIPRLKQSEQIVLARHYGLDGNKPMSLSEIGTLMDYSRERIRQIEKSALLKLKENFESSDDGAAVAA